MKIPKNLTFQKMDKKLEKQKVFLLLRNLSSFSLDFFSSGAKKQKWEHLLQNCLS